MRNAESSQPRLCVPLSLPLRASGLHQQAVQSPVNITTLSLVETFHPAASPYTNEIISEPTLSPE